MSWSTVHDYKLRERYAEVHDLAEWSPWMPFASAIPSAPREPGVYLLREPLTGIIRYVGMAGERAGGGRPQGLYGRLKVYSTAAEPSAVSAKQPSTVPWPTPSGWSNNSKTSAPTAPNAPRTGPAKQSSASTLKSPGQSARTPTTPATWKPKPSPCSEPQACGTADRARIVIHTAPGQPKGPGKQKLLVSGY